MTLDVRTVFVMAVGFLLLTTITLGQLVRTLPADTRRSARYGVVATGALALSWALLTLQGLAPELWWLLGGNLLYLVAAALVYQSVRLLDGEPPNCALFVYVVGPALLATLGARYLLDLYLVRVIVMSAGVSLLLGLAARRLFTVPPFRPYNPGRRPAAYWLAAASAVLAARVVLAAVVGAAPPLFESSPAQNLAVTVSVILALGAVFSYFLLFSGRVTAELATQAHRDPLTALLNRRGFEERANEELMRATRNGSPVSVLMIDANDFKTINDTWGHSAGDEALHAIADGLRARVRPYDLVARLGGDEFAVLLPGLGAKDAASLIPRLHESIAQQPTRHPGTVAVSIGLATRGPLELGADAEALRKLLADADHDLYDVKRTRV